jgi:hypothetical protein
MKKISLFISGLIFSLSLLGFSTFPCQKTTFVNLESIFRTIDPNILPHGSEEPVGGDLSAGYIQVLNQKATEIRNYISNRYHEDLSNLSNIEVIVMGLIGIPFESRDNLPGYQTNAQIFDCMMTAVGASLGISALISLWNSGASFSTVLGTLKSILRVSYGWFAVGYAVYKFGQCVHWW